MAGMSSNPFADDLPPRPSLPDATAEPASSDGLNPYAAPVLPGGYRPEFSPGIGIWREGNCVVIHPTASFPRRCVLTNEPEAERRHEDIAWSQLLAVAVRHQTFEYSLSAAGVAQRKRQRIRVILFQSSVFIFFALTVFGTTFRHGSIVHFLPIALFVLGITTALILFQREGQLLVFRSCRQGYFWLTGPKTPFLDTLPAWPGFGPQ